MHTKQPGEAHHALMEFQHEVHKRFAQQISPVERLAIAAQFVGQLIGELDDTAYGKGEIMKMVSGNMQAGNDESTGSKTHGLASGLIQ